jgi:putative tryptophan/tyrosine transport system substrate-binding protein
MPVIGLAVVLAFSFTLGPLAVEGQQTGKVPRVGILAGGSVSSDSARMEAFRQGLRELGYIEGNNIVVEYRYAEGKLDRLNELAAALVRLKVDVIVTAGPVATRSAKEATASIPIVMAQVSDPMGLHFVASLARPSGKITGLSTMAPEISGKQLEFLKEILPRLSRLVVLGSSTQPANAQILRETELAAVALGVKLQHLDVLSPNDIEGSFRVATRERADAVLVLSSPLLFSRRKQIVDLAIKSRLPMISSFPEFVEDGGLLSYSANINDLFRRAAIYVDKILKGAKPGDLPIEQPTKFELVINLKTAKALGLTIPPSLLARADAVME